MNRIICTFFSLFLIFSISFIHAQSDPPEPCNNGTENTCKCDNSPLLCSFDVLNGYTYSMTNFGHAYDGPGNPMCMPGGNGTTAHNPTWFRFIALCEDIQMTVNTSNCNHGGSPGCNSRGVQLAVFPECDWQNPWDAVACDVNSCRNNAPWSQTISLSMTGLTIGKVYSLVVDGCCNSACTVTITVTTPPCFPTIADWPSPIQGPTELCVGDGASYCIENAIGGLRYFWTDENGNIIQAGPYDESGTTCTDIITFPTKGTYMVCVDTDNACVTLEENPPKTCITINVHEPNAGTITANPTPTCPGRNVNIQVNGNATDPGLSQYIVIVDASGTVVKVTPGTTDNFTWPECGTFTAYSFNYVTAQQPVPQEGDSWATIIANCSQDYVCCDHDSVDIIFEDNEPPVIQNVPDDITISCYEDLTDMPTLNYTDNCLGPGTVMGEQTDNYTDCGGGTITRTWTVEDGCGNITTETQLITVEPIPVATFTPFEDETVPCEMFPPATFMPPLNYNNGKTGACQIMGTIMPTRVVDTMQCMGTVTYNWMTTDKCMRDITETQVYTIEPPLEAEFVNPPADITVTCNEFPAANYLPTLQYTNGSTGICLIFGEVTPTQVVDTSGCQGTVTLIWDTTDRCGRNLHHEQVITIEPPQEIMFLNPPADATVDCADIPDPGVLPPLTYTNGEPAGRCLIQGTVIPTRNDNYDLCGGTLEMIWEKTDSCGRTLTHIQNITVNEAPEAQWVNPPADVILPCGQTVEDDYMPELAYTNGVPSGNYCSISGVVMPTREDDVDGCEGTVTFTWTFTDACGRALNHTQVFTLSPPDEPMWINPPADITVASCDDFDFDALPELMYDNGQTGPDCSIMGSVEPTRTGSVDDCQGAYVYTWTFMDKCGREITHTRTVTVVPPDEPMWINPPADITVASCDNFDFDDLPELMYDNGQTGDCAISGTVQPDRTGSVDNCQGSYTYMWSFTDDCGRTIEHSRTITVVPPPDAQFTNPPASETVSCEAKPSDDPKDLNYTNNGAGSCLISGTVSATPNIQENSDCSKVYTYEWEFTDECNRTITHTQLINVLPPPAPVFLNAPADITVSCNNAPDLSQPQPLNYTNNLMGECGISGSVDAQINSNVVNCVGTHVLLWEFTDFCGRTIQWTQTITVNPPATPSFVNPPPATTTVTCEDEPDPSVLPELHYTNNETGLCLIEGDVVPTLDIQENGCAKIYTYEWRFTDMCDRSITYTQVVNVSPPPTPTLINPPTYTTMSCADAELFDAPNIEYSNNSTCEISGVLIPVVTKRFTACGGNIEINWTDTDRCGRVISYNQFIVVTPAAPPTITSVLPQDITVSCQSLNGYEIPLNFSNGADRPCAREGVIIPVLDASRVSLCGGVATLTWQMADECGHILQHVQNITVEPAPPAVFLDLPDPVVVVSCSDVPGVPPALNYSNGESGMCGINGSVTPIQSGSYNSCGGTIQYTWQFTDACGRNIVYNQDVVVLPADEPWFTVEPDDEFLPCYQGFPGLVPLTYTNGLLGPCAIDGSVIPTFEDFGDTRVFTWTYTNTCTGNVITVDQEVTISPVPNIIVDPVSVSICSGDFFNIEDVQVIDLEGTNIVLTYHTGSPATVLNQLSNPYIGYPGTFYILATNEYGCADEAAIQVNLVAPPNSGFGKSITICSEGPAINLWNLLDPPYDNNGYWSDEYGFGINVSDPTNVSFAGQPGGTYTLFYVVSSDNICDDAMTPVEIIVVDPGYYEVTDVTCTGDFSQYAVTLNVWDYNVTSNVGTITRNGNTVTISNIPIGSSVEITFTSLGLCENETLTIDPPQCDCPVIPNPISGGNMRACQNQTGVTLSVTVGPGLNAQWYSAQTGGTLLLDNMLTFEPPTSVVGITTYYVQAIDPETGCKSQRIAIQFEVVANPSVTNVTLRVCDEDPEDGIALFNLDDARTRVVTGGGFTFSYHTTLVDAQNETNAIPSSYTNTSNNQVIYVVVKNANGCKSIAEVTLNVLPLPDVTLTINDEVCSGNRNGSIIVNPPTTGLEFKLNNLPWSSDPTMGSLQPGNFTLQVRDGNMCIATYPVTINEGQRLSFETFTITCNNKGTLSDGGDDTYDIVMNVVSLPNAPGNNFRVVYNGVELGNNLNYGAVVNISLPADGTSGTLEVIDNVTGCKVTRNIGPLTSCSTTCAIELTNVSIDCDNNGTDSDPSDDTYTISFVATAFNNGTSTTFTVLINNVIQGTYNYGQAVNIVLPADGSTPDIRIRDGQNIQCFTQLNAGTLNSCSGTCQINATVSNVLCNDNGSINDPNDDTFTFTIRVTGNNISTGWRIAGVTGTHPYNTNVVLGPYPISGGNLSLTIIDEADANCTSQVSVTAPAPCSTPCILEVVNVTVFDCDNNNTGNTAADDFFSVSFRVNALSGSYNFYNVTFNGNSFGPFNYGQDVTINNLPANSQDLTLTITDAINSGCVASVTVKQNPCSSCPQTVDAGADIVLTCTNNTATLSATASHTGGIFIWTGPNGFNVSGQTVSATAEGEYTVTVTYPDQCVATDKVLVSKDANLPIANAGADQELTCNKTEAVLIGSSNFPDNITYIWTNAAGDVIGTDFMITVSDVGVYYLEVTNTLNNCKSGKDEVEVFNRNQQLRMVTNKWVCDNNDTKTDGGDDFYTYTFSLSNTTSATNSYTMYHNGTALGTYNYNQEYSITIPADGSSLVYEFVDNVSGCKTNVTVGPLTPCSTDCELTISDLSVVCFDNGTESIDSDDYYEIKFMVTGVNTGPSNRFTVTNNGTNLGTWNYGDLVEIQLMADGSVPFIVVKDMNVNGCEIVVDIPKLNPCSSKCDIEAVVSNILCNDNGTINDPNDDVYYFDVVVTGLNTSSGWKVQGTGTVYQYGEVITLGPFPISGGVRTFTMVDNQSDNCTHDIQITPPAVCSEPCVITVANLNILDCNNNGTGNVTTDDIFSVSFVVNRISGSARNYMVTAGSKVYGPFNYGTGIVIDSLPANGQNIRLVITDPSNSGCMTEVTVSKQPCSSCNQTADAGTDQLITCEDNTVTLTGTATPGGIFEWTGPNGFEKIGQSVTTSTAGKYYLTVTYPDQCTALDSVIVTKDANVPDAFGGQNQLLTCIVGEVVLIGSTNTQSTTLQFIWKDEQGVEISNSNTVIVNTPGIYSFEVINLENGCSSGADEVIVDENVNLPEAVINADPGNLIDCIVGTVTLSGKPVANVIFNWNTGETFISNQPSIIVSREGTVTMTAIDTINGCENSAMIDIIDLQDYPILVTTPALPITCEQNGVYLSAGLSPEGPDLVFSWYDRNNTLIPGANSDSLYVTSPGTYYVILTDTLNGCSNIDTFLVDRIGDFPNVLVPDNIQLFCGLNTVSLTAEIINPVSSTTLKWNSNDGNIVSPTNQAKIDVQGSGLYTVEVTYNASGCTTTENVYVLVDNDYPVDMRAIIDDETCKDEKDGSIIVDFVSGGKEPLQYSLNNGALTTNNTFSPILPGSYNLRVVDANGCTLDTVLVVNPGYEVTLFALSPIELIYKQTRVIELITNLSPDEIASIKWSPSDNLSCDDCLITTLTGLEDVNYTVEIVDIHGCTQSVRIAVRINDNAIITVPNIIDTKSGGNQYFSVFANESVISVDKLAIYDRWGNLMFLKENITPNQPTEGWNGTLSGRPVEQGVYVYIIHYTTPSGSKILTGDVTVMR